MTGDLIREKISSLKVDTSFCETISDGKAGWYLVESGAEPRPDVVLNRNASSIAQVEAFNFDWKKILQSTEVFHTSGITAGLSSALTSEVKKAMGAARTNNTLVSYDFNYRKNIWSIDESIKRQSPLLPLVNILFCAQSDIDLFFKTEDPFHVCPDLKYIVMSSRSADESEYCIKVITKEVTYHSQSYKIQNIDRIGVGDSMSAGFFAGLLKKKDLKIATEWAALAGAMKYGIKGDMALLKESELTAVLQNGVRGIIR